MPVFLVYFGFYGFCVLIFAFFLCMSYCFSFRSFGDFTFWTVCFTMDVSLFTFCYVHITYCYILHQICSAWRSAFGSKSLFPMFVLGIWADYDRRIQAKYGPSWHRVVSVQPSGPESTPFLSWLESPEFPALCFPFQQVSHLSWSAFQRLFCPAPQKFSRLAPQRLRFSYPAL